jgi:hypothetical protein
MNDTTHWGVCMACTWWQIEPSALLEYGTHGLCIDERLQPYVLRVSGRSGCNRFTQGEPARAEGSGACPPVAEPAR